MIQFRTVSEFSGSIPEQLMTRNSISPRKSVFSIMAADLDLFIPENSKIKDRLKYERYCHYQRRLDGSADPALLPQIEGERYRRTGERRRLRCSGHIVNLCAEVFTRGDISNDKALKAVQKLIEMPAEEKAWREKERWERCVTTTVNRWFRISPLRKQKFGDTHYGR